jgi:fucose permease
MSKLSRTDKAEPTVLRWRIALCVIFGTFGFASASWLSRLPTINRELAVSPAAFGLILSGMSIGSLIGLVIATNVIGRLGAKRTIAVAALVDTVGLPIAAIGAVLNSPALVVLGLFIFGSGFAVIDVSMNVSGAANEHALRRTVMPLFHAVFSLGTVAGVEVGALFEALHVPVLFHISGTALATLVAVLVSTRWLQPENADRGSVGRSDVERRELVPASGPKAAGFASSADNPTGTVVRKRFASWREPRTIVLAVLVLGMTFAQGVGNNWLPIAMVEDRGMSSAVGDEVLGLFLISMTIGRFIAGPLIDRFGRVAMLRCAAGMAAAGVVLVILVPSPSVAFIGAALWGAGVSLGFPVGMSAAADDPTRAASRIAVISILGTFASLTAPPLIGFVANEIGVTGSFVVALALIAIAGALSHVARPLRPVNG